MAPPGGSSSLDARRVCRTSLLLLLALGLDRKTDLLPSASEPALTPSADARRPTAHLVSSMSLLRAAKRFMTFSLARALTRLLSSASCTAASTTALSSCTSLKGLLQHQVQGRGAVAPTLCVDRNLGLTEGT